MKAVGTKWIWASALLLSAVIGCGGDASSKNEVASNKKSAPTSNSPARPLPFGRKAADNQPGRISTDGAEKGGDASASSPMAPQPFFPTADIPAGVIAARNMEPPPLSERHDLLAGWIHLFNGVSLFGWTPQTKANWTATGGVITASEGEPGLLTTNMEFGDYHLRVDFRTMTPDANSGVFLHTVDNPGRDDVTTRCYEVNIAPDSNPFPTGSIVGRVKSTHSFNTEHWCSLEAKVEGGRVMIFVNGQLTADYTDPRPLRRGKIGLQFNSGEVQFREIKLRPLGLGPFSKGGGQDGWKLDPAGKAALEVSPEGILRLRGGKGYLESERQFKDFVLQAEIRTNRENQNSGIFFRTIPGSEMMGYECQIHNGIQNGQPLDCGTGGIFRRQEAYFMPARDRQWFALTLICHDAHMGAWVNGIQVTDWTDDRPADENPRKGKRLDAGTIQLQGHDADTDVSFRQFRIAEMAPREEPATP